MLWILIGLVLSYWISLRVKYHLLARSWNCKLPKNKNVGLFGILYFFKIQRQKKLGDLIDVLSNLLNEGKDTITFRVLFNKLYLTKDPENIKAMLGTQFNDFILGRYHMVQPLLGDGIFSLDGDGWKHSRALLRPQFAREQIGHVEMLEPHFQMMKLHILKHSDGSPFDIQDLFFRFTIDSATEFLFGESCSSLCDEQIGVAPKNQIVCGSEFAKCFNMSQAYTNTRILTQRMYIFFNSKEYRECNKVVHKFADYYVQKVLGMNPEELEKASSSSYVFLYELAKKTRDPKMLRDQSINILLAGRDTTAGLLSFAMYELAKKPDIWHQLRKEIVEHFGCDADNSSNVSELTFESLKKCDYLKAVISETLRLYPSVPNNFRVPVRETTLPRGGGDDESSPVFLQKGDMVAYNVYAMQRNKQVFGQDADEFIPERWFKEDVKTFGWAYLPFNGGPRICLGQQFALTEASYVIARLCMTFSEIDSYEENYPPVKMHHLTLYVKDHNNISLVV